MEAYIFVNSDPQLLWEITKATLNIEGVESAHAVTGQFDIVAYAEFTNMDTLREILNKIRSIRGVRQTQTAVAIPPRLE